MPQVSRVYVIGMLNAGMSTKAVAYELHIPFTTISWLQSCFRVLQYILPPQKPQTMYNNTSPGSLHQIPDWVCMKSATDEVDETSQS